MDSTFYFDDPSLFEVNSRGESAQMWVPDMKMFDERVDLSTHATLSVPRWAQEENVWPDFDGSYSALKAGGYKFSSWNTWEDFVDNDFLGLATLSPIVEQEQTKTNDRSSKISQPLSPSESVDSGIGSPGSSFSPVLNVSSPRSQSENSLELPEDILELIGNIDEFPLIELDVPLTGSNIIPLCTDLPDEVVEPVVLIPDVKEVFSKDCITNNVTVLALPQVSSVEVLISSDLPATSPASSPVDLNQHCASPEVMTSVAVSTISIEPSREKCGRKSKVTSTTERKQRKRDQNKTAATRYREKKRAEAKEREEEYALLNDKNKSLRDKAAQINREIDTLKELMIEVYNVKTKS